MRRSNWQAARYLEPYPETQSEHDLSGQLHCAYDLIGKLEAESKALGAQLYSDVPVAEAAE